jgi:inosine-uridine nucleoside N-ribohydrolase
VLDDRSAVEFAREFVHSPRREFNIRLDPEAASIVSRAPWKKITVVPVDPSTPTQLSEKLLSRLTKAATPALGKLIAGLEAGFPLWDEIVAAVVIDPTIVTKRDDAYVDYDTQFGATYGDTLSWREGYQPELGEQKADVVLAVDPPRLAELILRVIANRP